MNTILKIFVKFILPISLILFYVSIFLYDISGEILGTTPILSSEFHYALLFYDFSRIFLKIMAIFAIIDLGLGGICFVWKMPYISLKLMEFCGIDDIVDSKLTVTQENHCATDSYEGNEITRNGDSC